MHNALKAVICEDGCQNAGHYLVFTKMLAQMLANDDQKLLSTDVA